jgi:hypothetical protein
MARFTFAYINLSPVVDLKLEWKGDWADLHTQIERRAIARRSVDHDAGSFSLWRVVCRHADVAQNPSFQNACIT